MGHDHGVKPGNIVGAIANEAGLDGNNIGHIDIQDSFSLVDLPTGMPKDIFNDLIKVRVCGRPMQISRFDDSKPHRATTADSKPARKRESAFDSKPGKKRDSKFDSKPGKKRDSKFDSKPGKKRASTPDSKPGKKRDSTPDSAPKKKRELTLAAKITGDRKARPKPAGKPSIRKGKSARPAAAKKNKPKR